MMSIAGSGVATTCALGLLKQLAARAAAQTEFVEYVREQAALEFETLRTERDHARDLACRYEAEIARLTTKLAEHEEVGGAAIGFPACPVCGGVIGHIIGCDEMDRPR